MRIVFGVLGLLVVLAIVGSLAKTQLRAVNAGVTTRPAAAVVEAAGGESPTGTRAGAAIGAPGATPADTSGLTLPQQSRSLQQQVRDDTARALQQGADRNARAAP